MIVGTKVAGVLGAALGFATGCAILALAFSVYRLIRGPALTGRIVALDTIWALIVVFLGVFKIASGLDAVIYAAIAVAVIAFLGAVAFAQLLKGRGADD